MVVCHSYVSFAKSRKLDNYFKYLLHFRICLVLFCSVLIYYIIFYSVLCRHYFY